MYENLFYQRLEKLRSEKGVSARDMSLSIGQSAGYINALENRNGFPSMQVFFYICEYLGVTPAEFFDSDNSYPTEYKEMFDDIKALDHEHLGNVKAIIKGLKKYPSSHSIFYGLTRNGSHRKISVINSYHVLRLIYHITITPEKIVSILCTSYRYIFRTMLFQKFHALSAPFIPFSVIACTGQNNPKLQLSISLLLF